MSYENVQGDRNAPNEKLSPLDTRQRDAIFMFKAMYQPAHGQYVAFGLDIEQSAIDALNRYGIDAIKALYQQKIETNQLGMLKAWSVATFSHEFQRFNNPVEENQTKSYYSQFSEPEQASRWLALIYAENKPGEWIFDRQLDPKYLEQAETLIKHYSFMAIQNLFDYTIANGNGGRYGSNPDTRQIAIDIIKANQWRNLQNQLNNDAK